MTDRPNHRAAAERMLADADEWTAQAGELDPAASELSCLAYATVHALLAIHDALTAPGRYFANEERQRKEAGPDPLDDGAAATLGIPGIRYAANEAKQWEAAEPDPLDEDDHRAWLDRDGDLWVRHPGGCWYPLTFAPEPPPDAAGDDLSASEGESVAEEGGKAAETQEPPLLCPECGHPINAHSMEGCLSVPCNCPCDCPRTPEDVVRALIAEAAKPTWCPTCGHHRDDHRQDGCVPTCECAPVDIKDER